MTIRCNSIALCYVINDLRGIAETIRSYRDVDRPLGEQPRPLATVPAQLHMAAAGLESEMRGWFHLDARVAQTFPPAADESGPATIDFSELAFPTTVLAPRRTSREVALAELAGAAATLRSIVSTELPEALESRGGRMAIDNLTEVLRVIDTYIHTYP